MLFAVGEALSLKQSFQLSGDPTHAFGQALPDEIMLAQTGQAMPGAVSQEQLVKKAQKAIDKDNLKKMGQQKHDLLKKIKRELEKPNSRDKRAFVQQTEDILDGNPLQVKSPSKRSKSTPPKEAPAPEPQPKTQKPNSNEKIVRGAVKEIEGALKEEDAKRSMESKLKMQKIVGTLRDRMKIMEDTYKKKSLVDQELAVKKYQET